MEPVAGIVRRDSMLAATDSCGKRKGGNTVRMLQMVRYKMSELWYGTCSPIQRWLLGDCRLCGRLLHSASAADDTHAH